MSVKTLLVLRHAKSSWKDPYLADHDRPLNKRGKQAAPLMGELLQSQDLLPELIISSTARRAVQTAELVAEYSGYERQIHYSRDLYAADPQAYIEVLQLLTGDYDCVMVVGHNPGLEDLIEMLTGEWERMPTAALAQVELPLESWQELSDESSGRLVNLWRPKELNLGE